MRRARPWDWIIKLATLTWHEDPKMLEKQILPTATTMGNHIYVLFNKWNGSTGKTPAPLQQYTKSSAMWQYKSSLPEDAPKPRTASFICFKNCLYLVGGTDRICACYTTNTDTWTLLNRPSKNHWGGSAVVLRETIYICGGNNNPPHADVEEYNIAEDKWTTSSLKLPKPLNLFTAAFVSFV